MFHKRTLTREERTFVIQVIDEWEDGMKTAERATILDPNIASPDELNDLMTGYDDTHRLIRSIRRKVYND